SNALQYAGSSANPGVATDEDGSGVVGLGPHQLIAAHAVVRIADRDVLANHGIVLNDNPIVRNQRGPVVYSHETSYFNAARTLRLEEGAAADAGKGSDVYIPGTFNNYGTDELYPGFHSTPNLTSSVDLVQKPE